jgi:tight adherence protein B
MELTTILLIGGGLAFFLLVIGIVVTVTSERSLVEERLGRYLDEEQETGGGRQVEEGVTALSDWFNIQVEKFKFGANIAKELARADVKLRPGEYLGVVLLVSLVLALIGWFYGGGSIGLTSILFAVIGGALGPVGPRIYLKRQQTKRLQLFVDQLPDMLNLMVNGLRAGYSNMQAMEAVSKELPSPISDEFRRVVQEMQLGIPMEIALDNLLRRIPSDDLDLIITALNVQREVGGNLAEILDVISFTIRERIRIKREIQVLTAQVLYSGRVLALMPIILMLVLYGANRPYMMQFFLPENRLCGIPMLITGAIMVSSGYYAMTKIATIEV